MIIAAVGFALGPIAVAALARWVALLFYASAQVKAASGHNDIRRAVTLAVCQSLFHAGPWSVATVAFFAYQTRSESWAPWFFGGFAAGFLLMGIATVQLALRFRNAQREAANAKAHHESP